MPAIHEVATLTSKGQITLPKSIRQALGVDTGGKVAFDLRGGCGFSFGNGCSDGASEASLFGGTKKRTIPIKSEV